MPCYKRRQNSITVETDFMPCGPDPLDGAATCCSGLDNMCLSNGFCAVTGYSAVGRNISGYYIGGCTDPTFSQPGCRPECSQYQDQDAVWTGKSWSCCGDQNGRPICSSPMGPVFNDDNSPDPFLLTPIAYIEAMRVSYISPTATVSASVSVATVVVAPTASGNITASSEQASGLSTTADMASSQTFHTAAIAAIAALAMLLALSWVGIGAWCSVHRRKRGKQTGKLEPTPLAHSVRSQPSMVWTPHYPEMSSTHLARTPTELPDDDVRRELQAGKIRY